MADDATTTTTVEQATRAETASEDEDTRTVDEAEVENVQVLVIKGEEAQEVDVARCDDEAFGGGCQGDEDAVDDTYAKWMRHSFADELTALDHVRSLPPVLPPADDDDHSRLCDECNKRSVRFDCSDCSLSLCFACTDAIHIIDALAKHTITWALEQHDAVTHEDAVPQTALDPPHAPPRLPPRETLGISVGPPLAMPHHHPSTHVEHRLHLPIGTKLFFRADDCGRWTRELLHGSVIGLDHGVRSNAHSDESLSFYYRVLWLRGVEALANGFFRASLLLPAPWWPVTIGLFPSQLSAFRAVLTAERLARAMLRRERVSGRWHDHHPFPSVEILDEILDETDAILGHEFRTRLTQQDDAAFLSAVARGCWDWSEWLETIGRENDVREEAAAIVELGDELRTMEMREHAPLSRVAELLLLWSPRGRTRFFLVEQHALLLPERVQRTLVASIVSQMLFMYVGFAWRRWRKFTTRHRRHELAATRITQWWRRLLAHWRLQTTTVSPVDALTLYCRRQEQAAKLYEFMTRQYTETQRRALQRWAQHTINSDESSHARRAREAAIAAAARGEWHPSHGIASLPRLPRIYAHWKPDGSVAIDDLALYKQFRSNHAGPTESSYWLVRHRVLLGAYPVGPAFRDARRIVSRADATTSVLLEGIGTFLGLAEPHELQQHELHVDASCLTQLQLQRKQQRARKAQDAMPTPEDDDNCSHTPWLFERIVRAKHELLRVELAAAVKSSERHAELAQRELDDWLASKPVPLDESALSVDARALRETLANKLTLAQQHVRKAHETLAQLPPLAFAVFPIAKDAAPHDTAAFEQFLCETEDRLRRRERLYVFSMQGHGRTGLVAALLLGRLYGLTAADALERAQRHHDCQPAVHGSRVTQSVASPHAAPQITTVTQLLARYNDAVYARVVSENSAHSFVQWRAQQRGLPLDNAREGFLVGDRVDEATQRAQQAEVETRRRVAKRESAATKLQLARRREQRERQAMAREEEDRTQSGPPLPSGAATNET